MCCCSLRACCLCRLAVLTHQTMRFANRIDLRTPPSFIKIPTVGRWRQRIASSKFQIISTSSWIRTRQAGPIATARS